MCVNACVKPLESQGTCWCFFRTGWQQERASATNENTLAFFVVLGLIIPAYLRCTFHFLMGCGFDNKIPSLCTCFEFCKQVLAARILADFFEFMPLRM